MVHGVTGVEEEVAPARGPGPKSHVHCGVGRWGAHVSGPKPCERTQIVGAGRLGVTHGKTDVEEVACARGPGPQSRVQSGGVGRLGARISEPEPSVHLRIVGEVRLGVTRGVTNRSEGVVREAGRGRALEPPPT